MIQLVLFKFIRKCLSIRLRSSLGLERRIHSRYLTEWSSYICIWRSERNRVHMCCHPRVELELCWTCIAVCWRSALLGSNGDTLPVLVRMNRKIRQVHLLGNEMPPSVSLLDCKSPCWRRNSGLGSLFRGVGRRNIPVRSRRGLLPHRILSCISWREVRRRYIHVSCDLSNPTRERIRIRRVDKLKGPGVHTQVLFKVNETNLTRSFNLRFRYIDKSYQYICFMMLSIAFNSLSWS